MPAVISRRTALKLLASTSVAASLPWLRSPSVAAAASPPLRMLFVDFTPGLRRGTFEPERAFVPLPARTTVSDAWAFADKMSALRPYQDRAIMFNNLDMVSARVDPTRPANAHIDGLTHMLTASHRISRDTGGGPSIDQFIAQSLAKQGVKTQLQSLELLAWERNRESAHRDAYSAPGQRVPFIANPASAFDRVFGGPLGGHSGDPGAQAKAKALETAAHRLIASDYERLIGRISSHDRDKLAQMRDYRADLLRSLDAKAAGGPRPTRQALLAGWSKLQQGRDHSTQQNPIWRQSCKAMSRIAAAALHADVTRVANLVFEVPPDYEFGYTKGNFGSSDIHDLDHKVSGDQPNLRDPSAAAVIDRQHKVSIEMVRFLLDELAGLKESDGSSLLDHTLVVLYSHIGEGSHDLTRLPWVLFGNAHGRFKTGRYIQFPVIDKTTGRNAVSNGKAFARRYKGIGRPHNDLFVSLAQAMGVAVNGFGNRDVGKGPIAELIS